MVASIDTALDRMLDPLARSLPRGVAEQIIALRADDDLQRRMDELADRNTEGLLTADERAEYEAYIGAAEFLSLLRLKAVAALAAADRPPAAPREPA